jgi:hypothetical protein
MLKLDRTRTSACVEVPDALAPYYYAATTLLRTGRDPARAERYLRLYLEHEPEGNEPTLADARHKLNPRTK